MSLTSLQGGIVWSEEVYLPQYPSSLWSLKMFIRGPAVLDVVGTGSGDPYVLTIPAATSSAWPQGRYRYQTFAERLDLTDRQLVSSGYFTLVPDISIDTSEIDWRSSTRRILDAIDATIAGVASHEQLILMVGNLQLQYQDITKLIQAREYFWNLLGREEAVEGLGAFGGKKLLVRFREPR